MAYLKHCTAILLFVSLFINSGYAQNKGRVLNQVTGFPIELVEIHTFDLKRSSVSDKDGYFDLDQFSTGDTLYFRHAAFTPMLMTMEDIKAKDKLILMTPQVFLLKEYVVTAPSIRQNADELPNKVNFIDAKQVAASTFQNSADVLTATGNVAVQKTQGGGGSPIIRGFEANKILLVIDGVRMNNAIYRSGHLQNSITVDPAVLEQIDIIFGPTSIVYGSDALGGVVHYKTKSPKLSTSENTLLKVGAYSQYATATNSFKEHLNFNIGTEQFGSFTAVTYSNFGDTEAGKWRHSDVEDDYGLVKRYVERRDGKDELITNKDPEKQVPTGYEQFDLLQKFKYVVNPRLELEANFQYSTSSDIDRLDKLLTPKGEGLKFSEYGYGPQERFFGAVSAWYKKQNKLFTNVRTVAAYQRINEDRFQRKFDNDYKRWQREDVHVLSLNVDFTKIVQEENRLNYGIEITHNVVDSKVNNRNIITGERKDALTRYPDGGSKTYNFAAYAAYRWLISPGYTLNAGLRYNYSILNSEYTDNYASEGIVLPFDETNISDGAPTGNLSLTISPSPRWKLNLVTSSGFRVPNIDDYGKVREKSGDVTVPNNELQSEYAYNVEATFQLNITDELAASVTGYQTWLIDAIVRQPYTIEGSSTVDVDGDGEPEHVVTNLNADEAQVRGVSGTIAGRWEWGEFSTLKFRSTLNYTWGRNMTQDEPLGHIPPVFGRTSINFEEARWALGLSSFYNGGKLFEDMATTGEDNEDFASQQYGGYPDWWTLNFSSSYRITDFLKAQFSVDNIFDAHYRPFASPVAAPGRNFVFTLYFDF